MLDIYDYILGWAIYIAAGALCYLIFYRATGTIHFKPIANCLRGIMLAVMFTPWYVTAEGDLLAPAIIVMMLDMVTIGGTSFVRAMVPLVLSILTAMIIGLTSRLIRKAFSRNRPQTSQPHGQQ
ncbi:MAG: hypothetical protein Q8L60_02500 [Gammaproteobacteria bacterium]|nr:hypothetical protein [Gammaproteobacteria bacterium]MDP2141122.1 hypothetical protein [Gammaproteobacteria bacterium]MDP2349203.1 hypothetical protein [Gammaproteobacteria bacterium]